MVRRFLVILLSFIMMTSCNVGNSVIVVSTVTPFSTALPTATNTPTLVPIKTSTPTVSPDVIRYQCLEIADSLPPDLSMKGVIAYNDDRNLYAYLSNQETNDTYLFPREEGDRLLEFEASPNGKHISYIHYSLRTQEHRLVIATAKGEPIWSQTINPLSVLWDWFDNERLFRLEFLENETRSLQLFNPFNGERQNLRADFPDSELYNGDWYPNWSVVSFYDATLTRVIYPGKFSYENAEQRWPVILWDTVLDQPITEIDTTDTWGGTPLWTPDGKQIIIVTSIEQYDSFPPKEFFSISHDGVVTQLTHFADYFEEMDIINNYSMSPNGKFIAFWIFTKPAPFKDPDLAVLNIETGVVTNYCIKGDPFADNALQPSSPVWSPDSTQLLVISRPPEDTKVRRVVMVDIINNYAAQISRDIQPVGWMVAP